MNDHAPAFQSYPTHTANCERPPHHLGYCAPAPRHGVTAPEEDLAQLAVDRISSRYLTAPQSTPQHAPISQAVWPLVIADMRKRNDDGRHKYGVPLETFNGRDALIDAYQEALDLCVYLRQAIEERNSK